MRMGGYHKSNVAVAARFLSDDVRADLGRSIRNFDIKNVHLS